MKSHKCKLNNVLQNIHVHPEAQNVTLFENRLFEDVIKVKIEMRLYWNRNGLQIQMSMFLLRKKPQGHTHREEGLEKMEAEIGILLLPAKALQEPPESG